MVGEIKEYRVCYLKGKRKYKGRSTQGRCQMQKWFSLHPSWRKILSNFTYFSGCLSLGHSQNIFPICLQCLDLIERFMCFWYKVKYFACNSVKPLLERHLSFMQIPCLRYIFFSGLVFFLMGNVKLV